VIASILAELGASGSQLAVAALAALGIYLAVIIATRLSGLRSFSKMSAFDFAMTVAIGSLIATAASGQAPLASASVGVITLYAAQFTVALLRRHALLHGTVDNAPLLLMDADRILDDNLAAARLTRDDLHGKLREANVLHYGQVRAVVFETTGEVSVLHGEHALDPALLRGVRRSSSRFGRQG
jgi:uncharacterized membrane protein YcaP (DUF421 family)